MPVNRTIIHEGVDLHLNPFGLVIFVVSLKANKLEISFDVDSQSCRTLVFNFMCNTIDILSSSSVGLIKVETKRHYCLPGQELQSECRVG